MNQLHNAIRSIYRSRFMTREEKRDVLRVLIQRRSAPTFTMVVKRHTRTIEEAAA